MIREQAVTANATVRAAVRGYPGGTAVRAARPGFWARLVAWFQTRRRTELDRAITWEVRRHFGGRPAEPGDAALAEHLIREVTRRYGG